jgi:tetratricopeptide (TPR) repeat protein
LNTEESYKALYSNAVWRAVRGELLFSLTLVFLLLSSNTLSAQETPDPPASPEGAPTSKEIPSGKEKVSSIYVLPELLKEIPKLLQNGENQEALTKLKKARRELKPSQFDSYYLLKGRALFQLKDYPSAKKALERSLSYRAKNSDALHLLGSTTLMLRELPQAEVTLKEAVWFDAYFDYSPALTWTTLAQLYEETSEPEKMRSALENSSRGKKHSAQSIHASFRLARAMLAGGEPAPAEKLLNGIETERPVELLERETLLGQALLLSPSTLFTRSRSEKQAEKLGTQLKHTQESIQAPSLPERTEEALQNEERREKEIDPSLLRDAHETLVRLWLAANEPEKAEAILNSSRTILESSPGFPELLQQLKLASVTR